MVDINTKVIVQVTNGPNITASNTQQASVYSKNSIELPPGTHATLDLPTPAGDISLLVVSPNATNDIADPQKVAAAAAAMGKTTTDKAKADAAATAADKAQKAAQADFDKATDANKADLQKKLDDANKANDTAKAAATAAQQALNAALQQQQDAQKIDWTLKVTYTVNDDATVRTLDAPLTIIGRGAVSSFSGNLQKLNFTNNFKFADVVLDILVGYTQPAPSPAPAPAAAPADAPAQPASSGKVQDQKQSDGGDGGATTTGKKG